MEASAARAYAAAAMINTRRNPPPSATSVAIAAAETDNALSIAHAQGMCERSRRESRPRPSGNIIPIGTAGIASATITIGMRATSGQVIVARITGMSPAA
jgi:hypothetical protein